MAASPTPTGFNQPQQPPSTKTGGGTRSAAYAMALGRRRKQGARGLGPAGQEIIPNAKDYNKPLGGEVFVNPLPKGFPRNLPTPGLGDRPGGGFVPFDWPVLGPTDSTQHPYGGIPFFSENEYPAGWPTPPREQVWRMSNALRGGLSNLRPATLMAGRRRRIPAPAQLDYQGANY